jgi:hypothetical protein
MTGQVPMNLFIGAGRRQFNIASKVCVFNNLVDGVNSVLLVQVENIQRGSPKQKHFRTSFGVNLAPVR